MSKVFVDVVEPGKALVTIKGADAGGTIVRQDGRYYVENDHGDVIAWVGSYKAGARKLADHYGNTTPEIVIDHEHKWAPEIA